MNERLRHLCKEVNELAENIEQDLRNRQPERASQGAALYIFAKGYKSFQAAHLLFKEGFWQDAAVIGRTLLELGFQARWLNLYPENAGKLLLRHELRDRSKLLTSLKSSGSEPVRLKADAFLKRLNAATSIEKWRNWWDKESNIEKLAKLMELSPMYELLYRPLCWFVHSAPLGNGYYLREEGGFIVFESRPEHQRRRTRASQRGYFVGSNRFARSVGGH